MKENGWKELKPTSFVYRNDGYVLVMVKDHPYANKMGYVYYHRIVMENYIHRFLNENEIVHHIDENKSNNDISNLLLMTRTVHTAKHVLEKGKNIVVLKCPNCGCIFTTPKNESFLVKKTKYNANFCSRKCSGQFYQYIKHNGIDEYAKNKLDACLIEEKKVYLDHSYQYKEKIYI